MYNNSCKKEDSVAIILRDSTVIKGKVIDTCKVIGKREKIIILGNHTYVKHSSDLDLSDTYDRFEVNSSDIMFIAIKSS